MYLAIDLNLLSFWVAYFGIKEGSLSIRLEKLKNFFKVK
jgi:hypothetical protein